MTSEFGLWMTLPEGKFAPMSLTAVSVKVSVIDLLAEVDIVQSYLNNEETHPIETVYKLPIAKGMHLVNCVLYSIFEVTLLLC